VDLNIQIEYQTLYKRDDPILPIIAIIGKNGASERGMRVHEIYLYLNQFFLCDFASSKIAFNIPNVNTLPFI
jgi:hypothetical protein